MSGNRYSGKVEKKSRLDKPLARNSLQEGDESCSSHLNNIGCQTVNSDDAMNGSSLNTQYQQELRELSTLVQEDDESYEARINDIVTQDCSNEFDQMCYESAFVVDGNCCDEYSRGTLSVVSSLEQDSVCEDGIIVVKASGLEDTSEETRLDRDSNACVNNRSENAFNEESDAFNLTEISDTWCHGYQCYNCSPVEVREEITRVCPCQGCTQATQSSATFEFQEGIDTSSSDDNCYSNNQCSRCGLSCPVAERADLTININVQSELNQQFPSQNNSLDQLKDQNIDDDLLEKERKNPNSNNQSDRSL